MEKAKAARLLRDARSAFCPALTRPAIVYTRFRPALFLYAAQNRYYAAAAAQAKIVELQGPVHNSAPAKVPRDVTEQHVRQHSHWADPSSTYWCCIDGRDTEPIFSTPGGDYSELLMGLRVLEKTTKTDLKQTQVDNLFADWMEDIPASRKFYGHTDELSLFPLLDELKLDRSTNIQKLDPKFHEKAIELMTQNPLMIGCGHFRFGVMHPELYDFSETLPLHYLRTFYNYMWKGKHASKIVNVVLKGPHNETAVIVVTDASSPDGKLAPKIVPETGKDSVFVANASHVHVGIRNRVASFVAKQLPRHKGESLQEKDIIEQMNTMAARQQAQTVPRLAGHLPIYTLAISL